MDDSAQPASNRWWFLPVILIAAACGLAGLYYAGAYIYQLGLRASAQVSGITPSAAPSSTPLPVTPTITLAPTETATITPIFPPTITPTLIPWSACPGIVITVEDTPKGDFLNVLRCTDNFAYRIGPLTKGAYAVSPGDEYLAYASNDGILYAAKIGETSLRVIKNIKKDGEFTVYRKKVAPDFRLTFVGNAPAYVLKIYEQNYNQNMPVGMPAWLAQ